MTPKSFLYNDTLEAIELTWGSDTAIVTLQGAQVISYKQKGIERLWLSPKAIIEPNKSIRGGVPICWPWFGDHPKDTLKPAHGFVRTSPWVLDDYTESDQETTAVLSYQNEKDSTLYPHACTLQLIITMNHQLNLALRTTNQDHSPIMITQALHTYLPVTDLANADINGLKEVRYADKLMNFTQSIESRQHVNLSQPTDRVYFDASNQLTLSDKHLTTIIGKHNSKTTVIWNPGSKTAEKMSDIGSENYRSFLCVEAANALTDEVVIRPGEAFTLTQTLNFSDH